jgi:hypothetical protein
MFDFPGFGYVHIIGNNHQRKLFFIGFATIEVMDKKEFPTTDTIYTWNIFGKNEDGLTRYDREKEEWLKYYKKEKVWKPMHNENI